MHIIDCVVALPVEKETLLLQGLCMERTFGADEVSLTQIHSFLSKDCHINAEHHRSPYNQLNLSAGKIDLSCFIVRWTEFFTMVAGLFFALSR